MSKHGSIYQNTCHSPAYCLFYNLIAEKNSTMSNFEIITSITCIIVLSYYCHCFFLCFTCSMVWMSAAVAAKKRWQMTRDSAIVCQYDDRITKKLLHTNPILSFHSIHYTPFIQSSSPTKEENFWKVYHNRLLVWSQIPIIPLSSGLTFYTFSFHFLQNESQCDILAHDLLALFPPQKCVSKYSRLLFLLKRWWLLLVGFLKGTQIDTVAPPLSKSSIIQSTPTEWEWTAISTKK